MQNIKFVSIFAACGFVFSFLIGLLSKSKFYIILLKALLFGVIFGILALLISILYNKFLKDENSDLSETTGENQDVYESGNRDSNSLNGARENSKENPAARGGRVNFVVQDEELGRSESDNHFVVGENHQMLNNTDISGDGSSAQNNVDSTSFTRTNFTAANSGLSENPDKPNKIEQTNGFANQEDNADSNKFVPLKNFETVTNLSGKEAAAASAVGVSTVYKAESNSDIGSNSVRGGTAGSSSNIDDDIDTLPDMGGFSFGSDSQKEDSEDNEYSGDTDDSFGSSVSSSLKSRDDNVADVKDASLIAKAISSVLADENL